MGWIDDAKRAPLGEVLQHLGIGHVRGRTAAPCPGCNAERRGSSDKRGPLNLHDRDGTTLWFCHRCDAGGDGLDAVAWSMFDRKLAGCDSEDRERVRGWFADRGWCEAPRDHKVPTRPPAPPPVRRIGADVGRSNPDPPPADEVARLWQMCRPWGGSGSDIAPSFYLGDRGYDAWSLAGTRVVRTSPRYDEKTWSPSWWPAVWFKSFRLMFPAFTPGGAFASLHARRVPWYPNDRDDPRSGLPCCENHVDAPTWWRRDDDPWRGDCGRPLPRTMEPRSITEKCPACGWKPPRKTTWPRECSAAGLLFADAGGYALLRGEPRHSQFLVVEGVTDLLRASIVAPKVPCGVLGFASGGASALGEVRWPRDAVVGIATDADETGERYAAEALRAMPIRPRRIRWEDL